MTDRQYKDAQMLKERVREIFRKAVTYKYTSGKLSEAISKDVNGSEMFKKLPGYMKENINGFAQSAFESFNNYELIDVWLYKGILLNRAMLSAFQAKNDFDFSLYQFAGRFHKNMSSPFSISEKLEIKTSQDAGIVKILKSKV